MHTILYLIRHGETEWNKLGKFQGSKNIPLSEDGVSQAKDLAERLNGNFDYIYTSPLIRAKKTAEIISEKSKIVPIIFPDMREINYGDWEGLTLKEIKTSFSHEFKLWKTDKIEAPICGGDGSLKNASVRAKNSVLKIVQAHPGKKIVIVAHGGIIKAAIIGLFNFDMTMYHKIYIGNTSITKLIFNDKLEPIIEVLNDTSHLVDSLEIL